MSLQTRFHGLARLRVAGRDRHTFLHNMTTANIRALEPGSGTAAAVVNQRGVLIDWGWVHAAAEAHAFIGHAVRQAELLAWLDRYVITEDVTLEASAFAGDGLLVAGPGGEAALAAALQVPLAGQSGATSGDRTAWRVGGGAIPRWLVEGPSLEGLSDTLCAAGVPVADRTAWQAWRVAAGLPDPASEADDRANPWELGLDDAIALDKGCYLGQEVVARLRTYDKVQRRLAVLIPAAPGLRPGQPLVAPEQAETTPPLGTLTSVADAPTPRALALIRRSAQPPLIARTEDGEGVICTESLPEPA
jgi:folate-binding protein YgfZ